jgi:hypothetical protein
MKKIVNSLKFSVLAFLVLLVGCEKSEVDTPTVELYVNMDGKVYEAYVGSEFGNESCENLLVSTQNYDIEGEGYRFGIDFELSLQGDLLRIMYDEVGPNYPNGLFFLAPNFNPLSTFSISDFHYDPATGEIGFNYDGTVYYDRDNNVERHIHGRVHIESSQSIPCSFGVSGLSYKSPDINLFSLTLYRTESGFDLSQEHHFYSNNGYRVYLYFQGDPWHYPLGEITFSDASSPDRVEFAEVASFFVVQVAFATDVEWKEYETSGSIVLEDKYIENGDPLISGKMYLTIKDEGRQLYYLDGVSFRVGSFETP